MLSAEQFSELFSKKLCFCGSGKEYASCHRSKTYKNPIEIQHDQSKFIHQSWSCPVNLADRACGKPVIASHSQQKKGPLKQITEAGHVVGFSNGPNARVSTSEELELVSISAKRASTFPGLCAQHDAEVFSDIENRSLHPNFRTALGLATRCTLYEAIVHTGAALFLNWLQAVPKFDFPMDADSFTPELNHMAHYSRYNWELVNLLQRIKNGQSTRKFLYFSALINISLPFSATGCFGIENDLLGNKLQSFSDYGGKFSYAQLTVLPQRDGTTLASISSTNDKDVEASRRFVACFQNCPASDFSNAILRTALEYTENIYFRPSWVNSLDSSKRKTLLNRFEDFKSFKAGLEKPNNSLARQLDMNIPGMRVKWSSNVS